MRRSVCEVFARLLRGYGEAGDGGVQHIRRLEILRHVLSVCERGWKLEPTTLTCFGSTLIASTLPQLWHILAQRLITVGVYTWIGNSHVHPRMYTCGLHVFISTSHVLAQPNPCRAQPSTTEPNQVQLLERTRCGEAARGGAGRAAPGNLKLSTSRVHIAYI